MTAFADYLDLRTNVLEVVGRSDITDVFDRITKMAEARLNRELRLRDQITSTSVVVSSGTGTLPSDFLEMIGVFNASGYEFVQQPIQPQLVTNYSFYSIDGSNIIANDATYTVKYYAKLSTLTAGATTSNWLLQKYPEVYLYAVAAEAAKHPAGGNINIELAQGLASLRDDAIRDARADDDRARYSRARVRVVGNTP